MRKNLISRETESGTGRGSRIAKNSIFVLSARITEALAGIVIMFVAARCLGVELFGRYSLVLAIMWVLSPFLGFRSAPHILVREIVKDNSLAGKLIGSSLVLSALLALPVAAAALAAGLILRLDAASFLALFLTLLYFLFKAWINELTSIYIAGERMEYEAVSSYFVSLLEAASVLIVYVAGLGFLSLFISVAVANLLGLAITVFMVRRFDLKPVSGKIRYVFKESLPIAVSRLFTQAYLYVDVFILKLLTNDFEVGLFQASQRIVIRLLILPMSFGMSMMPLFSRMAGEPGGGGLKETYDKLFKLVLLASMLLTFIGFVLAGDIVRYLYGEPFLKAAPSLKLLFFAVPLLFLNYLSQIVNIACGKQVNVMAAEGAGLVANAALDVALIPRYGYMGASWATLLGCMTLFCANFFLMPRYIFSLKMASSAIKCVAAFLAAFAMRWYFPEWNTAFAIPGGMLSAAAVLLLTGFFSSEEIRTFKRALGFKSAFSEA